VIFEKKKLKFEALIIAGQSPNSDSYNENKIGEPFLQGSADFGIINPIERYYSSAPKKISSPGDILVSVRAPVGDLNISNKRYAIGRGLAIVRGIKSRTKFLYYVLQAEKHNINSLSTGSTFKAISSEDLKNYKVPSPELSYQDFITNFLDQKTSEIDTLIEDKEKLIALLEEKRQAIITEAVTNGLDPDVKMKDSGVNWIGKIPEHWELVRNKYLFKREKNIVGDQSSSYNVLSLTMRGVIHRDIESNEGKMPASFDSYQVVEPNNLLMCLFDIDVTPRTVGLVNSFGIVSPAYSNFKVIKENVDVSFYYYWYLMLDFDKKLLHLSKNLRNSIGTADFGALECPLPGFLEQQEIVKYLNEKETLIIESIAMIKEQIKVIKEYRQALIYEAVTGKIDVQVMLKETEQEEVSSS